MCDHCGKPLPYDAREDARFCSGRCRAAWANETKARWVEVGKRLTRALIEDDDAVAQACFAEAQRLELRARR